LHNRARTLSDLVLLVVAVAVAAAAIAVVDIAARRVPDGAEEVVARALAVEAGGGRLLWVQPVCVETICRGGVGETHSGKLLEGPDSGELHTVKCPHPPKSVIEPTPAGQVV